MSTPVYGVKPTNNGLMQAYCTSCSFEGQPWQEVFEAMIELGTHRRTDEHQRSEEAGLAPVPQPSGLRAPAPIVRTEIDSYFPLADKVDWITPFRNGLASDLYANRVRGVNYLVQVIKDDIRYSIDFSESGMQFVIGVFNTSRNRARPNITQFADDQDSTILNYAQAVEVVNQAIMKQHKFATEESVMEEYCID